MFLDRFLTKPLVSRTTCGLLFAGYIEEHFLFLLVENISTSSFCIFIVPAQPILSYSLFDRLVVIRIWLYIVTMCNPSKHPMIRSVLSHS